MLQNGVELKIKLNLSRLFTLDKDCRKALLIMEEIHFFLNNAILLPETKFEIRRESIRSKISEVNRKTFRDSLINELNFVCETRKLAIENIYKRLSETQVP
jgi:hypothetical protein